MVSPSRPDSGFDARSLAWRLVVARAPPSMGAFLTQRPRGRSGHRGLRMLCKVCARAAPGPVRLQLALCLRAPMPSNRYNGLGIWSFHSQASKAVAARSAQIARPVCASRAGRRTDAKARSNHDFWPGRRRGRERDRGAIGVGGGPGYCAPGPRRLSLRPLCGQLAQR